MNFENFTEKYGFYISAVCLVFFIIALIVGEIFLIIIGLLCLLIGIIFLLYTISLKKDKKIKEQIETQKGKQSKIITSKTNSQKYLITVEKYCKIAAILVLIVAAIAFITFLVFSIIHFVKAGKIEITDDIAKTLKETLRITGIIHLLYGFLSILTGIIISAILFAFEKIILLLNKNN